MSKAVVDDALWCINITGPDDVIAVSSREDAIRFSKRFNDWWITTIVDKGLHPYEPTMWAVPVRWPHDSASHAADLARVGEYGWLREPTP